MPNKPNYQHAKNKVCYWGSCNQNVAEMFRRITLSYSKQLLLCQDFYLKRFFGGGEGYTFSLVQPSNGSQEASCWNRSDRIQNARHKTSLDVI